jgi:Mn-dependent DtxR family transcriptional regulator
VASDSIPEGVRRFILAHIPSVPHLEAVRLLWSTPQTTHTTNSIARSLYVSDETAATLMGDLVNMGVAKQTADGYLCEPRGAEIATAVDDLLRCYQHDLVAVSKLIHDPTSRSAERFANAFKWRKDSTHG